VIEPVDCIAVWGGSVPYAQALELQMKICALKKQGFKRDIILLMEHPPTITLGRNADTNNLLVSREKLKTLGVELWNIDRGGDVTFHGPGQLVGYPILELGIRERDVHRYMHRLEESLIRLLAGYGIASTRNPSYTGVWTEDGKIAAMGIHISRWITRHGFALNINTDLSFYELIVPCGIIGKGVTSMQKQLNSMLNASEVAERYLLEFSSVFNRRLIRMREHELYQEIRSYEERLEAINSCVNPDIPAH
jgi:lipoate-protein ligase B